MKYEQEYLSIDNLPKFVELDDNYILSYFGNGITSTDKLKEETLTISDDIKYRYYVQDNEYWKDNGTHANTKVQKDSGEYLLLDYLFKKYREQVSNKLLL
jgi:hypothetical protein